MKLLRKHTTEDGLLKFIVYQDGEDISLGFDEYQWHTHADLLSAHYRLSEEKAIDKFIDDLLSNRTVIAISKIKGEIEKVWITDDPIIDLRDKQENEELEFRYWDGTEWKSS